MSYYIHDFKNDFDFDKLIITKQIKIDNNSFRYNLYYLDDVPKDLFIKLPPIRLIYNYSNLKYSQIKLPLFPQYDKILKCLSFFKKLQKIIKEKLALNKIFSNSIEKKDNLKLLKFNISPEFKDLKTNGELTGLINISYIWENENSYGLSLSLSKFNYTPKVENFNDIFIDDVNYKINPIQKKVITKNEEIVPVNTTFKISPNLLMSAINKLNKIGVDT
jgi:hypothetical protein